MNKDNTYLLNRRIHTAIEYEGQGKPLHAIQVYRNIISNNPDFIDAYYKLAAMYERMDNDKAAGDVLFELLDHVDDNFEVKLYVGHFLFKNKRWDDTIAVLKPIPYEAEPLAGFFAGFAYYKKDMLEEAKTAFYGFINNNLGSTFIKDALLYLSRIHNSIEEYEEAVEVLKRAQSFYNKFYELHYNFAFAYFQLGMESHAVQSIERALELHQADIHVYELAGKIYLKLEEYDKIENLYLDVISRGSGTTDIYTYLGIACLRKNKEKEAETYLNMALELNPENALAKNQILKYFPRTENNS